MDKINITDLKMCPLCGGLPELTTRGNNFTPKRSAEIKCTKCRLLLVVGAIQSSLDWAIDTVKNKWNTREESQ